MREGRNSLFPEERVFGSGKLMEGACEHSAGVSAASLSVKASSHRKRRATVNQRGKLGAIVQARKIFEQAGLDAEHTGPVIEHVRDGKPLTAIGAKLLGVRWPE